MKIPLRIVFAFFLAASVRAPAADDSVAAGPSGQPDPAARAERLAWFSQARLGMFIHWGLYAIPAGQWPGRESQGRAEWIMQQERIPSAEYEKLAAQFNPGKFDARAWVAVAKAAGMKYLVITAKHHDGFSMFATKQSRYNIVDATPFAHDPLKDLAAACHEAGIVFCVYYSLADWHEPDSPAIYSQGGFHGAPNPDADVKKYDAYMRAQVRELLTNYGPIGIVWFDNGGAFQVRRAATLEADRMVALIHELQPATLINNRLGVPADYGTPEQTIPGGKAADPFEVCMTLNRHWGYNRFDQDWKSPALVVRNIADIVSKGGNYLLNVGPTAEGEIPGEAVRILREVGAWTALNGAAIYGAGPTPFGPELGSPDPTNKDKKGHPLWIDRDEWRCTTQPGKLYFTLLKWPGTRFTLPTFSNRIIRAHLLADPAGTALPIRDGAVVLPEAAPAGLAPVLCVEIEGAVAK